MYLKVAAVLSLFLLMLAPLHAEHQQKTINILIIESMTLADVQARTLSFKKHLHQVGLYRNNKLSIRTINAEADWDRGRLLLRGEIVSQRPDLVVSVATLASQIAREELKDSDIPQLFVFVSDPVKAGLADQVDKATGSNITGVTHGIDLEEAIKFVIHIVAKVGFHKPLRIGVLHSDYPSSVDGLNRLQTLEKGRDDVLFTPLPIRLRDLRHDMPLMIQDALSVIEKNREKIDVIWLTDGPLPRTEAYVRSIAAQSPVPIIFSHSKKGVQWGVWSSIFSGANQEGHQAALMANAILHGTPIESIPVMQNVQLGRAVNPRAAEKWNDQIEMVEP